MNPLPRSYWLLWAKSGAEGADPGFHPLICHLIDVAMVARALWETALAPSLRARLAATLGLPEEAAGRWIAFLAGLHDLGKATPAFACAWKPGREALQKAGFSICAGKQPHGLLTAAAVVDLLKGLGLPALLAQRLAVTIGGHHGLFPSQWPYANAFSLGQGRWAEGREALFHTLHALCGLPGAPFPNVDLRQDHWFFLTLAALTSVADWIGSDANHFPFAPVGTPLEEYAARSLQTAREVLRTQGWVGPEAPPPPATFAELFERSPRPMQRAVIEVGNGLVPPFFFLIEAPMGEGKTEAALYLADRAAASGGSRGAYFAGPTQATSNQIFSRVHKFLSRRYAGSAVNLQLVHGNAVLSAEYQRLRAGAARLLTPEGIYDADGYDQAPASVVAGDWFVLPKRSLLALFGVGTVDQALLSVLQTKHFFVRLFGLAHKTVIVDEVHAYDAYMSCLLERLVQWLGAMGASVILLSATLPASRRERLVQAFAEGAGIDLAKPSTPCPYPRITWVSARSSDASTVETSNELRRTIQMRWLDEEAGLQILGEQLRSALDGGGCAVVFCNTVKQAQAVYRALRPFFPAADAGDGYPELELFHARNLQGVRQWQEARARLRFGAPDAEVPLPDGRVERVRRPHRAVLVATQVAEQSLDLDFDLVVSFLPPVDLLLQRAGRLHRHDRERPPGLKTPTLWVIRPSIDENGRPIFGRGTEAVYDRHILLRTWWHLRNRTEVAIPGDIEALVEAVYSDQEPPGELPAPLLQDWLASRERLERNRAKDEGEAGDRLIDPPTITDDLLVRSNAELEEDDPRAHRTIQALTRLTGRSIRAICLYGSPDRPSLDPEGLHPVGVDEPPSLEEGRLLLERSTTLTGGVVDELTDPSLALPGWRRSSLLRHHRALFFSPDGVCEWKGWRIRIDPELGVIVARGDEEVDE